MRALFLDFDGVTHPVSAIADWRSLNIHSADMAQLIQKRDLFRWLPHLTQALHNHPDVLLVVHSGWRGVADNTRMREILGPQLAECFMAVTSVELNRHEGIQALVQRSGLDHYLVIDDAIHEFPPGFKHLLATNPDLGLSDPQVLRRLDDWLEHTSESPVAALIAETVD